MEQAAAFRATFSDFKLIKTRATVQIILELPVEQSTEALTILGGMPLAGSERWVAVARLVEPSQSKTAETDAAALRPASRSFNELPLPQQAALTCKRQSFHKFLRENYGKWRLMNNGTDEEKAALLVQTVCHVKSRSEILPSTPAAEHWRRLNDAYLAWLDEPAVV